MHHTYEVYDNGDLKVTPFWRGGKGRHGRIQSLTYQVGPNGAYAAIGENISFFINDQPCTEQQWNDWSEANRVLDRTETNTGLDLRY